ncbi:MAG: molybdopterin-synthase adenylyltransferase MoeB [Gammaproteobacteria bacterium]|nr:molybdopterin-synthase adenylyltransferase MoeB [Gammaproteobacteria bacterium]NNJ96100.1 molybdopterin-synthase adenylyltransferase MoeB [Gammaproteobacteria bacterium]
MNDQQLLRYNRQIMLPQIDIAGQQKIAEAHVVIIGVGGLGSPAAIYLTAAGVGTLTLVDFDRVELTNLQRQIVHHNDDIDTPKVKSARRNLLAINPDVRINTLDQKPEQATLNNLAQSADVVIDASDNYETRFSINRACVAQRTPLVSGAATRFEGQVSVFDKREHSSPCYQCLYPQTGDEAETCSEAGVLAPVVGVIGSVQALEAIKLICGIGEPLIGRLLILDALTMKWHSLQLRQDPACPVCGDASPHFSP